MAQTVAGIAGVNALVQVSADGATWFDISGSANQIGGAEQRRMSGEAYTFEGDTAIIKGGKREPMEIVMRAVYTPTAGESFERIKAFFIAVGGSDIWMRYAPGGLVTGRLYACEAAKVTRFQYPQADAADANPIAVEFGFRCPELRPYHGGVPLAEYQDLALLYNAMGGTSWTLDTNWLSDAALVEDWYGITTANGRVTEISLAANALDGTLPVTFGARLPKLRTVDLADNALSTAEVDAILTAFYTNRLVFDNNPLLLAVGGTNGAPTGTVQAPSPCPAANAGEMAYELVNDSCGTGHDTWVTVTV